MHLSEFLSRHLSEFSTFRILSFVRIDFQNIVICPNRFSEYCHLSESTFRILSFVRIDFQNIVICPNRFSEYCHLSESTFRILSFVRIDFQNIVICPKVNLINKSIPIGYDTIEPPNCLLSHLKNHYRLL